MSAIEASSISMFDASNGTSTTVSPVSVLEELGGSAFLITYLVLLLITTVCGNIGNVMVIGAVLTDRRLRKAGNLFILNLAIADLCVTGRKE